MEFTGERFLPGQGFAPIAYEHLSRYLMAQPLVSGRHVLDIGCGAGYGARLLADAGAAFVVGLDISQAPVAEARRRYADADRALWFVRADATHLPLAARSLDLAVAFEMLEHLAEHDTLLAEIVRVLVPNGVLLISTPNKRVYSDLPGHANPYHLKELYFDEFRTLLQRHFAHVRVFAQKNIVGSLVAPLDQRDGSSLRVRRVRYDERTREFEACGPDETDQLYFVAVCSDDAENLGDVSGVVVPDRDERWIRDAMAVASTSCRDDSSVEARVSDEVVVQEAMDSATRLAASLNAELRRSLEAQSSPVPSESTDYDIIVPVHNAPEALRSCLESLLANTDPRHVIHVIDDASNDPAVDAMLGAYAKRHARLQHYRLESNVGFPGVVNLALATTQRDVVLVNSDTVVPPGWLARMDRCRRSAATIHVVSPLSNNATICSVPAMNQPNALPPSMTVAELDRLVQTTSLRRYPRVPTAVGFCMLMSRDAIRDVGPFDMAFGRGYGEETDWCQRAWAKGFESALCDDLYVYHQGDASFASVPSTDALKAANKKLFEARWPGFDQTLRSYCAANPLRFQQHRLFHALRGRGPASLRVLHVVHAFTHAAGIETLTRRLVDKLKEDVESTVLSPAILGPYFDSTVRQEGSGLLAGALLDVRANAWPRASAHELRGNRLELRSDQAERRFAEMLLASRADIVQFNHIANHGSLALPLIARALGVKVIYVLHDYFLLCADFNLLHASGIACGEARALPDSGKCLDCLSQRLESAPNAQPLDLPAFLANRHALVQAVLRHADLLIAPSTFAREQYTRAFGETIGNRIRVVPHGTEPHPFARTYAPQALLRVAFLGNATHIKGIDTFLDAARMLRGAPIRMTVLGEPLRDVGVQELDNVGFRGSYVARELPRILQDFDVVCIASVVHETYCLALDEAFRAGVPVIATRMGAIPERLQDGVTGILVPPGDPQALCDALVRIECDREFLARMRSNVESLDPRTANQMASDYLAAYREVLAAGERDSGAIVARPSASALPELTTFAHYAAQQGLELTPPLVPRYTSERSPAKSSKRR